MTKPVRKISVQLSSLIVDVTVVADSNKRVLG